MCMLLDSSYNGECLFNNTLTDLSTYDILLDPTYINILNKVNNNGLNTICIGRGDNVFGVQTNDKRVSDRGDIVCYMSKQKGYKKYINLNQIKSNKHLNSWKVITAEATGTNKKLGIFGNSFIGKPNEVYSGSYISFVVKSENEATSLLSYLKTNFSMFFLSLRKSSQHIKPDTCKWIPLVPFDREWTDELLFDYFNLTEEERNIIINYDKKQ